MSFELKCLKCGSIVILDNNYKIDILSEIQIGKTDNTVDIECDCCNFVEIED